MALDAARPHRFTTEEWRRLVGSGAFDGLRVELLDGVVVDMSPQDPLHAAVVQRLMVAFGARLELVRVQLPLDTAEGWQPEPDVALCREAGDPAAHPRTALLVVEVSLSSRRVDRLKASTYATAGVPEYWIVDPEAATVLVHRDPQGDSYATTEVVRPGALLEVPVDGIAPVDVGALLAR